VEAVVVVVVATEFVDGNVNFVAASYGELVAVDVDIVVDTVVVLDDGHDVVDKVQTPAHYLVQQFGDGVVVVAGNAVAVVGAVVQ
jgi:hypothetical protein